MKGPIVTSLAISFLLFLGIIRVLYIKLSAVYSPEAKKFRKLAKSTLVLIPLFGVHYIVFLFLPNNVDERTELVKLYFEMFFNSIQGFFVALLFCFLNGEVQGEIRKTWARFRLTHSVEVCCCSPCPGRGCLGGRRHPHSNYFTYVTRGDRGDSLASSEPSPRLEPQGGARRGRGSGKGAGKFPGGSTCLLMVETTPLHPLSHVTVTDRQALTNGKGAYGRSGEGGEPIDCLHSSSNGDCAPSFVADEEFRVS